MKFGDLRTTTTVAQTKKDVKDTFRKWPEVQGYDIRMGLQDAEILFTVNGRQERLACERFGDAGTNLRALYLTLEATRLAAQRGILKELATIATALLGPGVMKRPAHEVLGIAESTPLNVAEAAYRTLAKERHSDLVGGSDAAMAELNDAIETFRQR